ncbi:MAG: hypothetical protein BroJett030_08620 [Alphaproteobacteria bacterium]|nr:MAG: hypothetical protein BroJett030_08620 [Alphaproteobacteria bacterium]
MRIGILAVAFCAGLLSASGVNAAGKILNNSELAAFFSGKTYKYYNPGGKKLATITYKANGSIASKLDKDGKVYAGKWTVNGNKYCTSYDYRPKTACFQVRTTATVGKFEDLANGKLDGFFVQ